MLAKPVLRYPGGKTRAVKALWSFMPEGVNTVISPFIGGGSFELSCITQSIEVRGYDVFKPLVNFWRQLLKHPGALADEVQKLYPLSKEDFYTYQSMRHQVESGLASAAVFYAINRCSFSGATLSGGMSPGHPRFTQSAIDRIRTFSAPGLSVGNASFARSLYFPQTFRKGTLVYLDPPYLLECSTLYGDRGSTHKGFRHDALRDILLSERFKDVPWFMSYNHCDGVLGLYEGLNMYSVDWKYGMSKDKSKSGKELVIVSDKLAHLLEVGLGGMRGV